MRKYFAEIVIGEKPLAVFAKLSIIGVWQGPMYPFIEKNLAANSNCGRQENNS